eukprot:scaffold4968_cov127-Cylindrotheca_fusiformis.AAC.6
MTVGPPKVAIVGVRQLTRPNQNSGIPIGFYSDIESTWITRLLVGVWLRTVIALLLFAVVVAIACCSLASSSAPSSCCSCSSSWINSLAPPMNSPPIHKAGIVV